MDFFLGFCGRTYDPDKADFFYLPIVRDIEYRIDKDVYKTKSPSITEIALLQALEKGNTDMWKTVFGVTDAYWRRNAGTDHILVMPAPVTNFRHESSRRGFFHYMSHLTTPIFLNVEYSLSFVHEYPICATQQNIVMPYPSIDQKLINKQTVRSLHPDPAERKKHLVFYRGGNHGECMAIRGALNDIMKQSSFKPNMPRARGYLSATFCPVPVGDSPSSKRMYDAMNLGCIPVVLSDDLVWAFSTTTGGTLDPTLFSIRLPQKIVLCTVYNIDSCMDNLSEEEIRSDPVLSARLPASGASVGSLVLASKRAGANHTHENALLDVLSRVTDADIVALQHGVRKYSPAYRFYEYNTSLAAIPPSTHYFPDGGAMQHMAWRLSKLKREGVAKIGDSCQRERAQKHQYIGKYPCERIGEEQPSKTKKPRQGL